MASNQSFVSTRRLSQYHEDGIVPIRHSAESALEGVDKLKSDIAPVETTDTSAHEYEEGDLLVYGGYLYRTLKDIDIGDSFQMGINLRGTNIASEIKTTSGGIPEQATNAEITEMWNDVFGS